MPFSDPCVLVPEATPIPDVPNPTPSDPKLSSFSALPVFDPRDPGEFPSDTPDVVPSLDTEAPFDSRASESAFGNEEEFSVPVATPRELSDPKPDVPSDPNTSELLPDEPSFSNKLISLPVPQDDDLILCFLSNWQNISFVEFPSEPPFVSEEPVLSPSVMLPPCVELSDVVPPPIPFPDEVPPVPAEAVPEEGTGRVC